MLNKIQNRLGANYIEDTDDVLEDIIEDFTAIAVDSIAFDISNNSDKDKLFPYVKKAVKAIYFARGSEGLQSHSVGSMSYSYEDIIDKLRNDIIKSGLRRLK